MEGRGPLSTTYCFVYTVRAPKIKHINDAYVTTNGASCLFRSCILLGCSVFVMLVSF